MATNRVKTVQAADILGLRPGTLEVWRSKGRGPRYLKIGKNVFYNIPDLDEFANANTVETIDTCPTGKRRPPYANGKMKS